MNMSSLTIGSVSFSEEEHRRRIITQQICRDLEGDTISQWSLQFHRCTLFIATEISDEEEFNRVYAAFQIQVFGNHILLGVGSVLNIITLIAMRKIIFIKKVQLCLTLLAVTDILHILLGPGLTVLHSWLMYDVVQIHQLLNDFYIYMDRIVKQFQVWVIQYLTLSRCQAILMASPVRDDANEMSRMGKMTLGFVFMLLMLNSPVLWLPKLSTCKIPKLLYISVYLEDIGSWMNFLLAMCIPCTVILASNMAIIIKIIHTSCVNYRVGINYRNSHNSTVVMKSSIILVLSSLFYVACTIPEALLERFSTSFLVGDLKLPAKVESFLLLYYLNNILHVFMYCLSSPEFRKQFCLKCNL